MIKTRFNWEYLPIICGKDQGIEVLLDDIFELGRYPDKYIDKNYKKLFKPCDDLDLLPDLRENKEFLYNQLSKLENKASKKDVAKVFQGSRVGVGELHKIAVILYLSGLWQLKITDISNNQIDLLNVKTDRFKLSDSELYFLEIPNTYTLVAMLFIPILIITLSL